MPAMRTICLLAVVAVACASTALLPSDAAAQFESSCRLSSVTDPSHYPTVECELNPRVTGCIVLTFEVRTDDPCSADQVAIYRRPASSSTWKFVDVVSASSGVTQFYTDCPPPLMTGSNGTGVSWVYRLVAGCPCGGGEYAQHEIILPPIQCDPD